MMFDVPCVIIPMCLCPPKMKINVCSYAHMIVEAMEREICISLNRYVHTHTHTYIYIYIYIYICACDFNPMALYSNVGSTLKNLGI